MSLWGSLLPTLIVPHPYQATSWFGFLVFHLLSWWSLCSSVIRSYLTSYYASNIPCTYVLLHICWDLVSSVGPTSFHLEYPHPVFRTCLITFCEINCAFSGQVHAYLLGSPPPPHPVACQHSSGWVLISVQVLVDLFIWVTSLWFLQNSELSWFSFLFY